MEPATIVVVELPLAPLNQGGGGGDRGRSGERGGGDGASRWGAPGGDGINGGSAGGAGGGYIGADAITAGVSWQAEGLNPSGIQSWCGRLSQLAYMSGRYNSNMPLWWCVVRAGGVREAWRFSMQWLCPVPCTPCIMGIVIRQSSQDAGGRAEHAEHKHACDKGKQANFNHERQHTATHSCYRLDTRGNTSSYYRGIGLWEISIYDKNANGMRIHHRSRRVGRTRSTTGMSPSAIIQRRKFERKGAQDSAQNGEQ